jgi:hypothetical protein
LAFSVPCAVRHFAMTSATVVLLGLRPGGGASGGSAVDAGGAPPVLAIAQGLVAISAIVRMLRKKSKTGVGFIVSLSRRYRPQNAGTVERQGRCHAFI